MGIQHTHTHTHTLSFRLKFPSPFHTVVLHLKGPKLKSHLH